MAPDATNSLTNERIAEATDEDVRECNNWLEKLRHRAASEPTGTLRVTVEQLNDIHAEYRKLLARLERVEEELIFRRTIWGRMNWRKLCAAWRRPKA